MCRNIAERCRFVGAHLWRASLAFDLLIEAAVVAPASVVDGSPSRRDDSAFSGRNWTYTTRLDARSHDLAHFDDPSLPTNPHGFNITTIAPDYRQVDAIFLATDGAVVFHPEPAQYFEFPIVGPLPEGLNFIVP